MKVGVIGLWHLGSVTAACVADAGFQVLAYDSDNAVIKNLQAGHAPLFEPGLNELIQKNLQNKNLQFSNNLADLAATDILWVTLDTPVNADDEADVEFVINQVKATFPYLSQTKVILISSQLPVGSTQRLAKLYAEMFPEKKMSFACSPENLRLGKAIEVFTKPDRIIVGTNTGEDKKILEQLFKVFSSNIVWMSVASAEMTKHALNAFLATSVVFINELASLCERVGADAAEVEQGLKSEVRIGPKAYLRPGGAFAGGTLARDITYLIDIGKQQTLPTKLFSAVLESNHAHKEWSQRKLLQLLKDLPGKKIAVLGLTYKPGTDTLRRSTAIETCQWLKEQGVTINAHDPAVKQLPAELAEYIQLQPSVTAALKDADAALISTEWPDFMQLTADDFITHLRQPLLVDPSGFLAKNMAADKRVKYFSVGKAI